jgi:hypothetical protein
MFSRNVLLATRAAAVVGLLPLYIKSHSHGDFIYDWSWAAAYRQLGRQYYPKLMSCLPHTPVAGPRLLVAEGPQAASHPAGTGRGGQGTLASRWAASSWHVALATEGRNRPAAERGAADQPRRPVSLDRSRLRRLRRLSGDLQCGQTAQGPGRTATRRGERAVASNTRTAIRSTPPNGRCCTLSTPHFRPVQQSRRFLGRLFRRSGGRSGSPNGRLHRPRSRTAGRRGDLFSQRRRALRALLGLPGNYHSLHFELCFYQGIAYCLREGLRALRARRRRRTQAGARLHADRRAFRALDQRPRHATVARPSSGAAGRGACRVPRRGGRASAVSGVTRRHRREAEES